MSLYYIFIIYQAKFTIFTLYIETINDPALMTEIEKLKNYSKAKVKYSQLLEKRLYEIALAKKEQLKARK